MTRSRMGRGPKTCRTSRKGACRELDSAGPLGILALSRASAFLLIKDVLVKSDHLGGNPPIGVAFGDHLLDDLGGFCSPAPARPRAFELGSHFSHFVQRLDPFSILEYYNSRNTTPVVGQSRIIYMARLDELKRRLAAYEERHRELAERLSLLGFMYEGSVVRQWLTCGKDSCVCHRDPSRKHGPYVYWTSKVKGRTVSRLLFPEEVGLYEEWIRNRKTFREIQRRMLALAKKAAPVAVRVRTSTADSAKHS